MPDNDRSLEGFDPLDSSAESTAGGRFQEDAARSAVANILRCYTGTFDVFSEMIQNALDAVEAKAGQDIQGYTPNIWVTVDLDGRRVRVVDNGIGMTSEEVRFCLRPNISYKRRGESRVHTRGYKGVGATFLAYGFSTLRLQTKGSDGEISIALRGGRQWAEDRTGTVPRPRFEAVAFSAPDLDAETSGTSVEVVIGQHPEERPRDLKWHQAFTAKQWFDMLRIKTPLGGVYLRTPSFRPIVKVTVLQRGAEPDSFESQTAEYFYPHDIPDQKVKGVKELQAELNRLTGDYSTRFQRLSVEYKALNIIWDIWDHEELLSNESDFSPRLTEAQKALIEQHKVTLYGAFLHSRTLWDEFNDNILNLRGGIRLLRGGMQIASDFMIQGELSEIPLTSAAGYGAQSHVIVHFQGGDPDTGRKTFQPEVTALAEQLAVSVVSIMKKYRQHLRPDTGARTLTPDRERHEWVKHQEQYRDENPLIFTFEDRQISIVSKPQQEQDVIALFHELLGAGVLKGYRFFSTSQNSRYDSLFEYYYGDGADYRFSRAGNPLGVDRQLGQHAQSDPLVLEYKYDLDALIRDFESEEKFEAHIKFVVCWQASQLWRRYYYLEPLLVGEAGGARKIFGSTHRAFRESSSQPVFEVLILEDLLSFLQGPDEAVARQRVRYEPH